MNEKDVHRYDNIINLPHHVSAVHPQMSMHDRAAQFSPFSALTGLDDVLDETARITDDMREIGEDRAAELDEKMRILRENTAERPQITIEYFVPDENKSGGAYRTVTGNFRRFDDYSRSIVLTDGMVIPAENIYRIDGDVFREVFSC